MATQDKYDRQLRMWGSDGQYKLNHSKILCLGLTSTGTEALKGLVLPGIGFFRIVTDAKVTERDLGRNFFLRPESVGKNLAKEALENLLELNPDVKGDCIVQDPIKYFETNSEQIKKEFSLIICDGLQYDTTIKICDFCNSEDKKFCSVRTFGQIGYIRIFEKCFSSNFTLIQLSNQSKMERNGI